MLGQGTVYLGEGYGIFCAVSTDCGLDSFITVKVFIAPKDYIVQLKARTKYNDPIRTTSNIRIEINFNSVFIFIPF